MTILAWMLGLLVGGFSLFVIAANWGLVIRGWRAKPGEKVPSCVPLMGGVVGGGAIAIAARLYAVTHHGARPDWAWMAWIPFVLDPGCMIVMIPVAVLARIRKAGANHG